MKTLPVYLFLSLVFGMSSGFCASLTELEILALESDSGLVASREEVRASDLMAETAGDLDDPRLGLRAANLPVESFDFNQEPMTQAIVSLSQAFPAGDTRELRRDRGIQASEILGNTLDLREKEVLRDVRAAWLDAWFAQQKMSFLKERQALLELINDAQEGRYGSGEVTQTSVAQTLLQLAQLEETLVQTEGSQRAALQRMSRWVGYPSFVNWPQELPTQLTLIPDGEVNSHPGLSIADAKSRLAEVDVELARQQFKPGFMLETAYGYREGREDFLSVGVSMNVPLFSDRRNDSKLAAKQYEQRARVARYDDQRRELLARVGELRSDAKALSDRIKQYEQSILPQAQKLIDLMESDYASGRADFVRSLESKNQLIGHRISVLKLKKQRANKVIQLRWLLEKTIS